MHPHVFCRPPVLRHVLLDSVTHSLLFLIVTHSLLFFPLCIVHSFLTALPYTTSSQQTELPFSAPLLFPVYQFYLISMVDLGLSWLGVPPPLSLCPLLLPMPKKSHLQTAMMTFPLRGLHTTCSGFACNGKVCTP
jgi:hypothetical protein